MSLDLASVLVTLLGVAVAVGLAVVAGKLTARLFFDASGAGVDEVAAPDTTTRR